MSRLEHIIYENNEILKRAIEKILLRINCLNNIIFINVSYSDGKVNSVLYSGMKYVMNLRAGKENKLPVIFYGFEGFESLKRKPEASILNSPATEYIKMPFELSDFIEKIDKLGKAPKGDKSLDKETQMKLADEKFRLFRHDCDNAITYLLFHIAELKKGNVEKSIKDLKTFNKDFISKRKSLYEAVRKILEEVFISKDEGNKIEQLIYEASKSYELLYRELHKKPPKAKFIIEKGDEIIKSLRMIKEILGNKTYGR